MEEKETGPHQGSIAGLRARRESVAAAGLQARHGSVANLQPRHGSMASFRTRRGSVVPQSSDGSESSLRPTQATDRRRSSLRKLSVRPIISKPVLRSLGLEGELDDDHGDSKVSVQFQEKKYIQGIFSRWDSPFEKAENVIKRNIACNQTYPFHRMKHTQTFIMRSKSSDFFIGAMFFCATFIVTTVSISVSETIDEFLVIPLMVTMFAFWMFFNNMAIRTIILNTTNKNYQYYRGKRLVYAGHVHNLYIRLEGVKGGTGEHYFKLVLKGFMVDEEPLSPSTTRRDELFKIGRRLAAKLDLNFFDYQDASRKHVIRHRCPYRRPALDFSRSTPSLEEDNP